MRPILCSSVGFTLVAVLAAILSGCAPSDDPIDRLDAHYEAIVRILRDPTPDIKAKRALIDSYWKDHQQEIDLLRQALEDEIQKAVDGPSRERFVKRFEQFLLRIREIQVLLKENGMEL